MIQCTYIFIIITLKQEKIIFRTATEIWASFMAQTVKNLAAMRETWVQSLGWEDPLEKGMATHSSNCAWRIPWTEEPGRVAKWRTQLSNFHRNMKCNKNRFPQILYLFEYFQFQVTENLNNYKLVHKIKFCK